jgi:hypothetical protein
MERSTISAIGSKIGSSDLPTDGLSSGDSSTISAALSAGT